MEPGFAIPDSTPRSSKTELVIGGIKIYIYGVEDLKQKSNCDIAVLFLAHNRTRNYLVTEGIAHEILHRFCSDGKPKKVELISVTFNSRNHGDREISPQENMTWEDGNENHGVDLLSIVDGTALDFKMVIQYLPAYLPQFRKFYNLMGGVSLGGHVSWRMPALLPGKIYAMLIVIGCPNLTSLLLGRLEIDAVLLNTTPEELYKMPYDQLWAFMTETQRRRWPRALSELVNETDRAVDESFPEGMPLLLQNGVFDSMVPNRYTVPWVEKRSKRGGKSTELLVQKNTGNSCTKEMVENMADWLSNLFSI